MPHRRGDLQVKDGHPKLKLLKQRWSNLSATAKSVAEKFLSIYIGKKKKKRKGKFVDRG